MFKVISKLVILFFYVILQISFLPTLGYPINNLNLILSIIIFVTIIISYETGLWYAFGSGLLLELYSTYFFGMIIFSLIIATVLINFLFDNFFTNRSFYSLLILGLIGTIIYNFLLFLINLIIDFINPLKNIADYFNAQLFYNLIWQIVLNLFILSLIFLILNFTSKQLKSVFIFPR